MGKKRRLNKFISKWIKSDLPEDRSTVYLLGVTRIPTSPSPVRRPCSLPLAPTQDPTAPATISDIGTIRRTSFSASRRTVIRRSSSRRREKAASSATGAASSDEDNCSTSSTALSHKQIAAATATANTRGGGVSSADLSENDNTVNVLTSTNYCKSNDNPCASSIMERSVDSIGTCSLDVEASVELPSDWSEASSVGTLRSASILTPPPEPHLPSYLSLACTVNGYSTTTNYDPIRLARSRDVSPHRLDAAAENLARPPSTYAVYNNLLSPPNLVPLPASNKNKTSIGGNKMAENTFKLLEEFYSANILSKESLLSSNLFGKDTVDTCIQSKCISFEKTTSASTTTTLNGQTHCNYESSNVKKEYTNGVEAKSFIQQRVERLYGPGALAQGFLCKRNRSRLSETETPKERTSSNGVHSKSFNDASIGADCEEDERSMKQSTSSPTLPVLRHLRPEFRAQLPIMGNRKNLGEGMIQKSITIPKLKEETKVNGHVNGHAKEQVKICKEAAVEVVKESGEKDGNYFLKILANQTARLLSLADDVEADLSTPNLSEEVIGKLRSTSGKARLLVSQKMQQFKGLCTNNINQNGDEAFPTTNEDLQGFWDMVMLQVNQVDALFEEVNVLRKNNWEEVKESEEKVNGKSKAVRKVQIRPKQAASTSSANEEARKAREAKRKQMIEERRKAMRAQQNQQKESIEIFVPESS